MLLLRHLTLLVGRFRLSMVGPLGGVALLVLVLVLLLLLLAAVQPRGAVRIPVTIRLMKRRTPPKAQNQRHQRAQKRPHSLPLTLFAGWGGRGTNKS